MAINLLNKSKAVFFFLALASLITISGFCQANTTTIISKIVNMGLPENIDISQAFEESTFLMSVDYIIENPSNETVFVGCGYTPIYRLKVDAILPEEELNITILKGGYAIFINISIDPGIISVNTSFQFVLKPYIKTYLPVGNYTFWIDFSEDCDGNYSLVPLKSFLNITEEEIFITHEADGEIHTYDRITVRETNFYLLSFMLSIFIVVIYSKKRKNKIS